MGYTGKGDKVTTLKEHKIIINLIKHVKENQKKIKILQSENALMRSRMRGFNKLLHDNQFSTQQRETLIAFLNQIMDVSE